MIVLPNFNSFYSVEGESLVFTQTKELLNAFKSFRGISGSLIYRKGSDYEVLIFTMELNIPNVPKNDIRVEEKLAILISEGKSSIPMVLALREDFPVSITHINVHSKLRPVYLCIYEESFEEKLLSWSAIRFLYDIQAWLERAAKGQLHQEDQPLEPFLIGNRIAIIGGKGGWEKPTFLFETGGPIAFISDEGLSEKQKEEIGITETVVLYPISFNYVHNVVNSSPTTLGELIGILEKADFNLTHLFERLLQKALRGGQQVFGQKIGLFLIIGLQRDFQKEPEVPNVVVIKIDETLGEIFKIAGVVTNYGGNNVPNIGTTVNLESCEEIAVEVFNPHFDFNYFQEAYKNGTSPLLEKKFTLIGVGALGSHFLNNLVRRSYGHWQLFDPDIFLPHNLTRHQLSRSYIGWNMAVAMAHYINNEVFSQQVCKANGMSFTGIQDHIHLYQEVLQSHIIFDISTSLAVERFLAHNFKGIKKISSFLNPRGDQLVILEEDAEHLTSLDLLEFQFYNFLMDDENFQDHYEFEEARIRYARGCRDITSKISQANISLFSGILANHSAEKLSNEGRINLFKIESNLGVSNVNMVPEKWTSVIKGDWEISITDTLLEELKDFRKSRLPNETGGILIGGIDRRYKKIYITRTILSPKDSVEGKTLYIRGIEGVEEELEKIASITNYHLTYLGEWHSHPDGYSTGMSSDDKKLFEELKEESRHRGAPAIMLIINADDIGLKVT